MDPDPTPKCHGFATLPYTLFRSFLSSGYVVPVLAKICFEPGSVNKRNYSVICVRVGVLSVSVVSFGPPGSEFVVIRTDQDPSIIKQKSEENP